MSTEHACRLQWAQLGVGRHSVLRKIPASVRPASGSSQPARKDCRQQYAERTSVAASATADFAAVLPGAGETASEGLRSSEESSPPSDTGSSSPQGDPGKASVDPIMDELHSCEEIEDVLEILDEEADGTAGYLVADAFLKCVNLAKKNVGRPGKAARADLAKIGRSEAFQTLLEWIPLKAHTMEARDLAICLWSLATMKIKVVRLLRLLQQELERRIGDMNAQDLAMVVWAFGSLKHNPGRLLDSLAEAAATDLDRFEPQGLSMMMWAFAKLDHAPPQEFLEGVVLAFQARLNAFSPQSVANIMYALGKLQKQCSVGLCSRVEAVVAAEGPKFKDIELANLLYGFVKSRYQPLQLIQAIEKRVAERQVEKQTLNSMLATLVWGAATLGLKLRQSTLDALADWALADLDNYTPLSLCNMLWGLAIMGEVAHPAFSKTLAAVVASQRLRTLEPRLMRQVFQAVATARVLGRQADLPEDMEATAHKWWRKATLGLPVSVSHDAVAKAVRRLGIDFEVQHAAGYGLPLVDIAVQTGDGSRLAVMVVSASERAINTRQRLGRALHDKLLLEAAGWRVSLLEATKLPGFHDKPALTAAVGRWLEQQGVLCDWQTAAASAPQPVPESVRLPPASRSFGSRDSRPFGSHSQRRQRTEAAEDDPVSTAPKQQRFDAVSPASPKAAHPAVSGLDWGTDRQERQAAAPDEGGESQEEKQRREEVQKQVVADALGGDFLSDWVGLSDWKAVKVVDPGRI